MGFFSPHLHISGLRVAEGQEMGHRVMRQANSTGLPPEVPAPLGGLVTAERLLQTCTDESQRRIAGAPLWEAGLPAREWGHTACPGAGTVMGQERTMTWFTAI